MNNRLWLAAALCLGVSLTPWGPILLYPFTYTTWFAIELLMDPPSGEALATARRRAVATPPPQPGIDA